MCCSAHCTDAAASCIQVNGLLRLTYWHGPAVCAVMNTPCSRNLLVSSCHAVKRRRAHADLSAASCMHSKVLAGKGAACRWRVTDSEQSCCTSFQSPPA